MKKLFSIAAILVFLASGHALATTMFEEKFICPVGGEKFKAYVVGSYSSWGQRPDGREYGTLPIYPIVECPTNGMLLIDDKFSPTELQVLNSVVPSQEYQAMRKAETPHYRAWWLKAKIGRGPYEQAWQLLQATWETDENWERKVRYQVAFVNYAKNLKRDEEEPDKSGQQWLMYNLRVANALRELGHYGKALELLDRIDKPENMPTDPDKLQGIREFIAGLRVLCREENPSPEPANLVPDWAAAMRCETAGSNLTAAELPVCNDPKLAPFRKDVRKKLAKQKA
jgi:hypothetical protein